MFLLDFFSSSAPFRACAGAAGAGGYNAPGLPNITGTFGHFAQQDKGVTAAECTGAFKSLLAGGFGGYGTLYKDAPFDGCILDASLANSIYGASNTVMPASVNLPIVFYLGTNA